MNVYQCINAVQRSLPECYVVSGGRYLWCEEQVIAYAAQEVAAERERCVRIVEAHRCPVGNSAAGEMAAEWTMEALREIRDAIRGPNAKAFLAPNTNVTGLAPGKEDW